MLSVTTAPPPLMFLLRFAPAAAAAAAAEVLIIRVHVVFVWKTFYPLLILLLLWLLCLCVLSAPPRCACVRACVFTRLWHLRARCWLPGDRPCVVALILNLVALWPDGGSGGSGGVLRKFVLV